MSIMNIRLFIYNLYRLSYKAF